MTCVSSLAERRASQLGASVRSELVSSAFSSRVSARRRKGIKLTKCTVATDVSSNGNGNGAQSTMISSSQLGPRVTPIPKPASSPMQDRYGWPDRSDMYILRTDGNACARTLVKGTGHLQLAYPSSHQYMLVWKQKPRTVMLIKKLGDELLDELLFTAKHLQAVEKVNVVVEPDVHHRLSMMGECSGVYTFTPDQGKRLGEFIDFVICLGGDGVMLHTALLFGANVPPVIAFHLGSLGFMSQHNYDNMREDISHVIHGHLPLQNCKVTGDCENTTGVFVSLRMRLLCELTRKGKLGVEQMHEVLNEVVLDRGASSFLTNINVFESGNFLTTVQADGVMIATPTGSTAYSAAAGGSMVHPNVPAILFTPVCPHSLNFRPIVLPDYADIELQIAPGARASVWVSFDGKYRQELHDGDVMRVRMSPNPVCTINRVDQTQDWMSSLNRCFGWSHRLVQRPLHSIDRPDADNIVPPQRYSDHGW